MSRLKRFYQPYLESEKYWYIIPRAQYWNEQNLMEAHRVFQIINDHRFVSPSEITQQYLLPNKKGVLRGFDKETQIKILDQMVKEGIVKQVSQSQTDNDRLAKLRNFTNLFKRLGLGYVNALKHFHINDVGYDFLETDNLSQILEQQMLKYQFYNPSLKIKSDNAKYLEFRIFPYLFILETLVYLNDSYLSAEEFVLFISIARNHNELEKTLTMIEEYRSLSETDKCKIREQSNITRPHSANASVTLELFGLFQCLKFKDGMLSIDRFEQAKLLVEKYESKLIYVNYDRFEDWNSYIGNKQEFIEASDVLKYYIELGKDDEAKQLITSITGEEEKLRKDFDEVLYERDIESFMENNLHILNPRYRLIGRQYTTDIGRIDLLVKNNGGYVVIELKRDRASDGVIGQTLRYIGWVKLHLAKHSGGRVRGIIVGQQMSKRLVYACQGLDNPDQIELREIDFKKMMITEPKSLPGFSRA